MKRIVIFVLLVLFAGCIESGAKEQVGPASGDPSVPAICSKIKDQSGKDSCLMDLAKEKNDMGYCDLIKNPDYRAECSLNVALDSGDTTRCSGIQDEGRKDGCIKTNALRDMNPESCAEISRQDARTECEKTVRLAMDIKSGKPASSTTTTSTTSSTTKTSTTTTSSTSTTAETTSTTTTTPPPAKIIPAKPVKIYFLDVGYGQSTLVKTENHTILTNCGGSPTKIKAMLDKLKITRLDYLIVTQPTEEDYSGCAGLMDLIQIDHVLDSGQEPISARTLYVKYFGYAQVRGYRSASKGHTIEADGVKIQLLHPPTTKRTGLTLNANSIVYKLSYGSDKALFLGDCDYNCDMSIDADVSADIVQLPNHGTKDYSNPRFIAKIKPEVAVIPAGPERGDTPGQATMDKLKDMGVKVYRLDVEGMIEIELNGTGYSVKT